MADYGENEQINVDKQHFLGVARDSQCDVDRLQ